MKPNEFKNDLDSKHSTGPSSTARMPVPYNSAATQKSSKVLLFHNPMSHKTPVDLASGYYLG